jgi:hypothetical protein
MRLIPIAVLVPLLASCASSGLYNMTNDWCAEHVSASEARCPKDRDRVVHNDSEPVATTVVARDD